MSTDGDGHPALNPLQQVLTRVGQSPTLDAPRRIAVRSLRLTWGSSHPLLAQRDDFALLLNRRRLLGCGVEVGVKRGEFSEKLLRAWRGRHLISVDPWAEAPADEYADLDNVSQATHDAFHGETLARLTAFGERSSVWRMTGGEAAARIPHHCLDFVYLDARHDYASVKEDLGQWFDKVRPGGIVAGHDYLDGQFVDGDFGVRSAVDEFFSARGVPVRATFADAPWHSWFVTLSPR